MMDWIVQVIFFKIFLKISRAKIPELIHCEKCISIIVVDLLFIIAIRA